MRAVVVTGPGPADVLQVREVAEPRPGPEELTIDVEYAGVGFVDTLFRAGVFALSAPFVPGIEVAGRVREVGPGVEGFTVGAPVGALLNDFGRGPRAGGYAQVAVAHTSMAVPLPAGVDPAVVAGVLVNGVTAWLALHDLARLSSTDDVLVLGASGGLGGIVSRLAAVTPARRVIGVVGSPAKRASAAAECTDVVVAAEMAAAVDELTAGRGVDVVVDPVGGALRTQAFNVLAPFGRHLILGNASGDDQAMAGDTVWHTTRQVSGLSLGATAHLVPDRIQAALGAITTLLDRGVLREPTPTVVPMAGVIQTHRALEERIAPAKTVLDVAVPAGPGRS